MEDLIFIAVLMLLGFLCGRGAERKHFASLRKREEQHLPTPLTTCSALSGDEQVERVALAAGQVAISDDYFKSVLAGLARILGGRLRSYESLLDRARREAILRMRDSAPGASLITNVRLETGSVRENGGKNTVTSVQVIAYGTAIWLR